MKTEFINDLPFADYLKIKAVSKSSLTDLATSPGLYYQKHIAKTIPDDYTEAKRVGTALHTMVLEPELFEKEILTFPEFPRKSKSQPIPTAEAKEAYINELRKKNLTPITLDQKEEIKVIYKALRTNDVAVKYLDMPGQIEQTLVWENQTTGMTCKARLDKHCDGEIIVDYKSTRDASPSGFLRELVNFKYHIQNASYSEGYHMVFGKPPKKFVFIAQEKVFPYLSGVYTLDFDSINSGYITYTELIEELDDRMASDNWPKACVHVEGEQELRIPQWAMRTTLEL